MRPSSTTPRFPSFMYFLISSMENLVFIKELLEKNVEKVDSFHIYILSGTWKWTNCESMPKKKLVKSFRKRIFPQAKGHAALGETCLDNGKGSSELGSVFPTLSPRLQRPTLKTALTHNLSTTPSLGELSYPKFLLWYLNRSRYLTQTCPTAQKHWRSLQSRRASPGLIC